MDRKTLFNWLIFAVITIFSIFVIWPPMPLRDANGKITTPGKIRRGLDLQGGTSFTVQIDKDELRRTLRALRRSGLIRRVASVVRGGPAAPHDGGGGEREGEGSERT